MSTKDKRELDRILRGVGRAMDSSRIDGPFIQAEEDREHGVAYMIKDAYVGDLVVQRSANGWWMNETKVAIIIEALKEGHSIKTACQYAGISRAKWQYFNKVHPEFEAIVEMCEEAQIVRAMNTVNKNLDDPKTARWFLQHRHPKFKTRLTLDNVLGRETPGLNTNLALQDEEDPVRMAMKLMQLAETMLAEHRVQKDGLVVPVVPKD